MLRLVLHQAPGGLNAASVMRLCSALPYSRHLVRSYTPQAGHNVKIAAIKAVVHHMGIGLKEARDWVEHLPKETDNADLARALEAVGCVVEQLGGSTPGAVVPQPNPPIGAVHYGHEGQGWQWVCGDQRGDYYHRTEEDAIEAGRKALGRVGRCCVCEAAPSPCEDCQHQNAKAECKARFAELDANPGPDSWRREELYIAGRMGSAEAPSDAQNWRAIRDHVNAYDHRRTGPDSPAMADCDVLQVLCDLVKR